MHFYKKLFLVIFLLAFGLSPKGQQVFNLKYPIPEYINFRNVISIDSGFIVAGPHLNPTTNVFIGFFDQYGTLKVQKSYAGKYPLLCDSGTLQKTNDGGFVIGSGTDSCAYIMKLNSQLDTLWLKYIWPNKPYRTIIHCCAVTNSGYYIVGYEVGGGFTQAIFMKTDLDGNYLWHKYYGAQYVEYFTKVLPTPDGGFLCAGFSNSFSPLGVSPGNAGQWYVVKTDSLGNLQWQKNYGNPELDDGPVQDMIMTQDSCFVLTGMFTTHTDTIHERYIERYIELNPLST